MPGNKPPYTDPNDIHSSDIAHDCLQLTKVIYHLNCMTIIEESFFVVR